ncbi:MAG: hypothetical protein OCC46_02485 [Pseudodesulfovibrio sp.]
MTHDLRTNDRSIPGDDSLEELLRDVSDEKEKARLTKAWQALGGLSGESSATPKPSRELEMIFTKNPHGSRVDEEMTDGELEMLAAAGQITDAVTSGTPGVKLTGGAGNDYLAGGYGDDIIDGEGGNDVLVGNAGDDVMDGGEGNDFMLGGAGDDHISGGDGNDRMSGGDGNDTLIGGSGNDTMAGGSGGDVFVFDASSGNDTITDFNPLEDSLQFEGMDQNEVSMVVENGNTIVTFGETTITVIGVDLTQDTDGSGGASW